MSTMVPMYGFGGGAGGTGAALTVNAPSGATVTVSKDGKSMTKATGSDGLAVFKGLSTGDWAVTITDGIQTSRKTVKVTTDYEVIMAFNTIPNFTYTGDYAIVDDADNPITTSQDNWKVRFLTSGTLTFTELNGADEGIDVFLVGGGGSGGSQSNPNKNLLGGGGGGGYTTTEKSVPVAVNTPYQINIGAGGNSVLVQIGLEGSASSAFGYSANGGKGAYRDSANRGGGGDGGSGGGGSGGSSASEGSYGVGGTDGGNGTGTSAGVGQGTTTREFGESDGKLYSSGGDFGRSSPTSGAANTGDGGDGRNGGVSGSGGSGIVIIRNARGVA